MASVQESIEVDVPVRSAYNQWTQFEQFPQFRGSKRFGNSTTPTAGGAPSFGARAKEWTESGAWRGEVDQDPTS